MIWTLLACVIAPAVFWIAYFRWKDEFRPEPLASLGGSFLLGIAAGALCFRAYQLLHGFGVPDAAEIVESRRAFLVHALLVIGPLEELAKALPFVIFLRRFHDLDESVDGIVYASCLGLGFATYENLHYLGEMSGAQAAMRAFASPLTHAIFASVWGFAFAWSKVTGRSPWPGVAALAVASVLHGLYDFLATGAGILRVSSAGLVLGVWLWQIWIFRRLAPAAQAPNPSPS